MKELKHSKQDHEEINIQRAFWIAIVFSIIAAVSAVLTVYLAFVYPVWQVFVMAAFAVLSLVFDVTVVVLMRRGRAVLGVKILYWVSLITLPPYALLITNVTLVLVIMIIIMGLVEIFLLFPPTWRKRFWIGPLLSAVGMTLIEFINPPFRYNSGLLPTTSYFGPAILVFLAVGILALLVRQAVAGNIRSKLVAAFIVFAIVSAGGVGYFVNRSETRAVTNIIGNNLFALSSGQANQVGLTLATKLDRLNTLALTAAIQQRAIAATTADHLSQAEIQALDTQWRAADAADNNSDPLVASVLNDSLSAELLKFQAIYPENVEVFLTDRAGVSVATTGRTSDYLQSDEEWWQAAYTNGMYIGQPEFDASTKTLAINMAVAVRASRSDRIVGILRTTVNINSLVDVLSAGFFGETGRTDIYLPDGQLIKLVPGVDGKYELSVETAYTDASTLLKPGENFQVTSIEAVPSLVSTAVVTTPGADEKSNLIKNLGWYIIAHQDQSEALMPVTTQTRTLTVFVIAMTILASLAAWILAQVLVGPILRLNSMAQKVSTGDLTATAKVETRDEVGTLAATFNGMVSQLRNFIGTLESRVAERTQSLELAADVGRSVSQVRALDVMLKDAAEIIRSRFDLYYAQVYLTNPGQTELVLQAGTGTVGVELLGRSHRLPFNTGSINGRAAVEKHSVVIADTTASTTFRPNPLLPDTRSEMAVPLLIGEKVVGVLDLQSRMTGALSEDLLPAFEALAGQLAIAIQNASLLAETEHARAEVETQARRLVRANWQDYQDAIHKPEHTGFMFEQNQVKPMDAASEAPSENAVSAPIAVTGEAIGSIVVELDAEKKTAQNVELVNTIARQVAQQVENLRLLESAERYRIEAEQAMQRVTREGWKSYLESGVSKLGFMYDRKDVVPVEADHRNGDDVVTLLLKVRDEEVGKLALMEVDRNDEQSIELANQVAGRLSAHIESLRQFTQTQSALAQSEKLFEASRHLTESTDLQGLVAAAVESLSIPVVNRAVLGVFDYGAGGEFESMTIAANWWNGTDHEATPIGARYPVEVFRTISLFTSPVPLFSTDVLNDDRVDASTLGLVKRLNLRAVAVLPLYGGSRQIGVVMLEAEKPHNFTQDEMRLFAALAPQIATVMENRRQYEQAQKQAERESTLNVISQKIQSATTVEAVLQIAARELGHALGAPLTIAQLGIKDK